VSVNEQDWLVTKAAVRGKSHMESGSPCQDACEVATSTDGSWLVAVVSDGAGTASRSEIGARLAVKHVASALLTQTQRLEAEGPGIWVKDRLHSALLEVREQLREAGGSLADFKCTLVGTLIGGTGGFLFHVGDGLGLASRVVLTTNGPNGSGIELWHDLVLSEPQNGEYINETFFITDDDWHRHLHSVVLPADTDIVALMSDGTMPLVLGRRGPNSPFIDPLVSLVLDASGQRDRDAIVERTLASPETYPVTGDDKTLVLALRRRLLTLRHYSTIPYNLLPLPAPRKDSADSDRAPHDEEKASSNGLGSPRLPQEVERAKSGASAQRVNRLALGLAAAALPLAILSLLFSLQLIRIHPTRGTVYPRQPDGSTPANVSRTSSGPNASCQRDSAGRADSSRVRGKGGACGGAAGTAGKPLGRGKSVGHADSLRERQSP